MNRIIDLQTALLNLLRKVHGSEVRFIVGGGFGIYLKTDHVRRIGHEDAFGSMARAAIYERPRFVSST